MKATKIGFVGIPVTDIERARRFYEGVLGLKVSDQMMGGQWIEYSIGPDTLTVGNVGEQWKPSGNGTSAALEMENFDDAIAELRRANVKFDAEPFETPCCHMAVVADPDGNKIIIHKLKPENEKGDCS
jgi:predicted enzyme related to lactoylglutathione lyase